MGKQRRGLLRHAMSAQPTNQEAPTALESGTYLAATGEARRAKKAADQVTLIVYGWHNVEPGTLSWVFPSYEAALAAAQAMRNAVRWAIVAGRRSITSIEDAREAGAVLAEQA